MKTNESKIGLLAYQLWEEAGRPSGRDLEFWLTAEAQLGAASKSVTSPSTNSAASADSRNPNGKQTTPPQPVPVKKDRPQTYPKVPKF